MIGSKNNETPAEKRASRDPAVWFLRPLIKSYLNIQVSIGMDLRSRQTRSAGTASIYSDKQEVLAQSLQQDVALLDCDPFFAGLLARAVPAGVAAFHCHWNNVLKRTIRSENAILTMSKNGCLKMKTKIRVF